MMLDAWDCIFLWVGQNARDDEKKEAERMAMVRCFHLPSPDRVGGNQQHNQQ